MIFDMHIELEMVAHGLGFVGEALNLYGAFILAKDLLEREEELSDREGLEELTNWLIANGLQVQVNDLDLKKPHAATLILVRKAVLIGKRGLFWLKLGFGCLALYHVLSFFASSHAKLT
jgi:hypothetical protein